jgi:hypothetical protein
MFWIPVALIRFNRKEAVQMSYIQRTETGEGGVKIIFCVKALFQVEIITRVIIFYLSGGFQVIQEIGEFMSVKQACKRFWGTSLVVYDNVNGG